MQQYANYGGNSGVSAFEIGADYIDVKFIDGGLYRYSYNIPGSYDVEQMKLLALSGQGLNTYISKFVRKNYAVKFR